MNSPQLKEYETQSKEAEGVHFKDKSFEFFGANVFPACKWVFLFLL
jgi:hypothetical protein